jgi:hypothetical protein
MSLSRYAAARPLGSGTVDAHRDRHGYSVAFVVAAGIAFAAFVAALRSAPTVRPLRTE